MGSESARKTIEAGTRATSDSRIVLRASAATPSRSPSAASRDALGNIAVAKETVIRECGIIQIRLAFP